jgi:hypothetical protein
MAFYPGTPKWELSQLCEALTLCAYLRLGWGLKRSYSPRQELSNNVLHTTYTQGNRIDSQLFVVKSQIVDLTPSLSFGHNLCFRCPNGSCEPIFKLYVSIAFQWYEELLYAMDFDPCDRTLKIWKSTETPTPKVGVPLGECECLFPHTLLHSQEHAAWIPASLFGLQPCHPLPWSRTQG